MTWEGKTKAHLSLDTGLKNSFTDCGGQYGKAGCYLPVLSCVLMNAVFRLSFVPFYYDRKDFL
jgi:hypothetical protein